MAEGKLKERIGLGVVAVLVLTAAAVFVRLEQRKGYSLKPGVAAPGFRLKGVAGGETALQDLRGQVVVVNLWASWCPPCIAEMPSLERLHQKLKPEGLVILGISVDEEAADAQKVIAQQKLTFKNLHDPKGDVSDDYHATGYPETHLVDRRGVVRATFIGPEEWDAPEMIAKIRELLDEKV